MIPPAPASSIRLGRVTVLPAQRRMLVDAEPVRIGGRAFDVLLALLERQGEVVSPRELFHRAWPGVFVAPNNLQVQVCGLRKFVGAATIITVPGRGYVFDAGIAVHRGETPSPAGAEASPTSPTDHAPLRGRADECATLALLLSQSTMVTVTGPGGIGKSRVLGEVLSCRDAPVARIELALLPQEVSVASSFASALDLEFGAPPSARQVARAATHHVGTVVLENAERHADQTAELADALTAATALRLVCTAQAPLQSRGEHVMRLAPLFVPEAHEAPDAPLSPAVELLFDAVSALNSRGGFTGQEVRDAAAICRHLDGNPLAIKLAAAHVDSLGLDGVRRRLRQRFELLKGTTRTITAVRQQSLLATMAWSWNLLTRVERETLAVLARFRGRFTLGMACRVLGTRASDEWQAMEVVESLVSKSAVLTDPKGRSGFRIPESTRMYAHRFAP